MGERNVFISIVGGDDNKVLFDEVNDIFSHFKKNRKVVLRCCSREMCLGEFLEFDGADPRKLDIILNDLYKQWELMKG